MIEENAKELVLSRLATMPDGIEISIGSLGSFRKEEMIENVENSTEVGQKIVDVEIEYLRDIVNGDFYKTIE